MSNELLVSRKVDSDKAEQAIDAAMRFAGPSWEDFSDLERFALIFDAYVLLFYADLAERGVLLVTEERLAEAMRGVWYGGDYDGKREAAAIFAALK